MLLVSIICPFRNSSCFIPGLIRTVQAQTYRNWELVLVDDASLDGGLSLAQRMSADDQRIRCLSAPLRAPGMPCGPWWPRNHGIVSSSGSLVAFLDVDDSWHPQKLEYQVNALMHTGFDLCLTGYARYKQHSDCLSSWRLPPRLINYSVLKGSNPIPLLTVLVQRRLLVTGFSPVRHEDYLLWLNLFCRFPRVQVLTLPLLLAFHCRHDSNLTRSRFAMFAWAYGVFRAHGCSELVCLVSVIRWSAGQLFHRLRCLHQPLSCTLSSATEAKSPLPLPPLP